MQAFGERHQAVGYGRAYAAKVVSESVGLSFGVPVLLVTLVFSYLLADGSVVFEAARVKSLRLGAYTVVLFAVIYYIIGRWPRSITFFSRASLATAVRYFL